MTKWNKRDVNVRRFCNCSLRYKWHEGVAAKLSEAHNEKLYFVTRVE